MANQDEFLSLRGTPDVFDNQIDSGDDKLNPDTRYLLEIEFNDENTMRREYDKLLSYGFIVRVKSNG